MQTKTTQDSNMLFKFIADNKDNKLTIFIVDDQETFLGLLKEQLILEPNFSVYTFTTGEECLNHLDLQPDLVIIDYHLDGVNPLAKKGNIIKDIIHERMPSAEVVIISSDEKITLIQDLRELLPYNVFLKNEETVGRLKGIINNIMIYKKEYLFKKKALWFAMLLVLTIIIISAFI